MKVYFSVVLLILISISVRAQIDNGWMSYWPFEHGSGMNLIYFDPDTTSEYSWKIGNPAKIFFSEAYSEPNVISTELDTTYNQNDTISFILKHFARDGFAYNGHAELSGFYKVDCDTLSDYGLIELSFDNGNTWLDLINDTTLEEMLNWYTPKPVLTGKSDWTLFAVNMSKLGTPYSIEEGDTTIRIRFSFISDSVENFREGLMLDDLRFEDYTTGVESSEIYALNPKVYPNPAQETIHIKIEENYIEDLDIHLFDMTGKRIYHERVFDINGSQINVAHLKKGIYSYMISYYSRGESLHSFGKIVLTE